MTFDEKAKSWDSEERIKRAEKTAEYMIKEFEIDSSKELFEIGSGTGILALLLADRAKIVTASDSSNGMLAELENKKKEINIKNIETLFFDIEKDEAESEKYDIVYSSMVLHHIEDISKTAEKIYKMLKTNGKAVMIDLAKENGDFHPDNSGIKHFGFTDNEITGYFNRAGFKNIKVIQFDIIEKVSSEGVKKEFPIFMMSADK